MVKYLLFEVTVDLEQSRPRIQIPPGRRPVEASVLDDSVWSQGEGRLPTMLFVAMYSYKMSSAYYFG